MKGGNILLIMVFPILLVGCSSAKNRTVPKDLEGVWKTTGRQYEDRFFELKGELITFVSGELLENIDVNFIRKINKKPYEKGQILYTIHYENIEHRKLELSFFYDPKDHGIIRLKNKKQVAWTREPYTEH